MEARNFQKINVISLNCKSLIYFLPTRLIELVPDDTDNSDGGGGDTLTPKESSAFEDAVADSLRLNLNNNNDGGDEDPGEERDRRDENNSANGRLSRGSRQGKTRSKAETSSKPVHRYFTEFNRRAQNLNFPNCI